MTPRPPLMPLDEALAALLARAIPLAGADTVSTFDADGRVLAQDLVSPLQVPPQDKAEFRTFLARLGYDHADETDNPAYRMFLGR